MLRRPIDLNPVVKKLNISFIECIITFEPEVVELNNADKKVVPLSPKEIKKTIRIFS